MVGLTPGLTPDQNLKPNPKFVVWSVVWCPSPARPIPFHTSPFINGVRAAPPFHPLYCTIVYNKHRNPGASDNLPLRRYGMVHKNTVLSQCDLRNHPPTPISPPLPPPPRIPACPPPRPPTHPHPTPRGHGRGRRSLATWGCGTQITVRMLVTAGSVRAGG